MRKLLVLTCVTMCSLCGCIATDLADLANFITALGLVEALKAWLATVQ